MKSNKFIAKYSRNILKTIHSLGKNSALVVLGFVLGIGGIAYASRNNNTDNSVRSVVINKLHTINNEPRTLGNPSEKSSSLTANITSLSQKSNHNSDNHQEVDSSKDENKPIKEKRDKKIKKCETSTIKIGTQCWKKENLDVGTMINGSINQTNNSVIEKYCYDNDPSNCTIYGGLYQWNEMMKYSTTESVQGICPKGFHLPSDNEWKIMEMFLGMTKLQADAEGNRGTDQGAQILITGTSGLDFPITGYGGGGLFYGINFRTWIWTSSQSNTPLDWAWQRGPQWGQISRDLEQKTDSMPVRCIQN